MTINRFRILHIHGNGSVLESCGNGSLCYYSEIAALEKERDELRAKVEALQPVIAKIREYQDVPWNGWPLYRASLVEELLPLLPKEGE